MTSTEISDETNKNNSEHIALTPDTTYRECRYCSQIIHESAKVCHHCQRNQTRFWNHFRIEQIGLLISIIMLLIAAFQLNEARQERIATKDALEKAKSAEERVLKLHRLFTQHALSVISSTYLSMITKNEFGTERARKATEETLKGLNSVLLELIPDPEKRKAWINNLQQKLPQKE